MTMDYKTAACELVIVRRVAGYPFLILGLASVIAAPSSHILAEH